MKILLVGASGTLGTAIAEELGSRHEIVRAGRSGGDIRLDIADADSIRAAFAALGSVDAVICAAGKAKYGPLTELTAADYGFSLANKLMGQVNLVLVGMPHVSDGGSFTLTTGILSHDPVRTGTSASLVNGAIESFVEAASIEMPRGQRINVVSPGVLVESLGKHGALFRGHEPVPAARAARAYAKSVEGGLTGQIFNVH